MGNTGPESTVPRAAEGATEGGPRGRHAGVGSTEPAKSGGAGLTSAGAGKRRPGGNAGEGRA
jgi:hypothetical protein